MSYFYRQLKNSLKKFCHLNKVKYIGHGASVKMKKPNDLANFISVNIFIAKNKWTWELADDSQNKIGLNGISQWQGTESNFHRETDIVLNQAVSLGF